MEVTKIDAVVTDMRMPEFSGLELLEDVLSQHPSCIRYVLSGYPGSEEMSSIVKSTHSFMTKPTNPLEIFAKLDETLKLRDSIRNLSLQRTIAGITSLPPLPANYYLLLRELKCVKPNLKVISDVISHDVSMAATILRTFNSSYYVAPRSGTHTSMAIEILGIDVLKRLVLDKGLFFSKNQFIENNFPFSKIWSQSLCLAKLNMAIAKSENSSITDVETSYVAGLMSYVGMIVLCLHDPEKYCGILNASLTSCKSINKSEITSFINTSSKAGAYLLSLWGFDSAIVSAVRSSKIGDSYNEKCPVSTISKAALHFGNEIHHIVNSCCTMMRNGLGDFPTVPSGKLFTWRKACDQMFQESYSELATWYNIYSCKTEKPYG
jgi:HD-like signal output (HDOD) protein